MAAVSQPSTTVALAPILNTRTVPPGPSTDPQRDGRGASVRVSSPPARCVSGYTVDFQKDGRLAGMLSVNGSTGAVWFHSWHGATVQMRDLGAVRWSGHIPIPGIMRGWQA